MTNDIDNKSFICIICYNEISAEMYLKNLHHERFFEF